MLIFGFIVALTVALYTGTDIVSLKMSDHYLFAFILLIFSTLVVLALRFVGRKFMRRQR